MEAYASSQALQKCSATKFVNIRIGRPCDKSLSVFSVSLTETNPRFKQSYDRIDLRPYQICVCVCVCVVRLTTNGAFGDKGSLEVDEDDEADWPFLNSLQKACLIEDNKTLNY